MTICPSVRIKAKPNKGYADALDATLLIQHRQILFKVTESVGGRHSDLVALVTNYVSGEFCKTLLAGSSDSHLQFVLQSFHF